MAVDMIRSSLKQLFRKLVRVLLFLILMTVVVLLLTVGIMLFTATGQNMREIEGAFQTIGLIEQKSTGIHEDRYWDGLAEIYSYRSRLEYGTPVSLFAFDFEEANYILPPQNRPYYCADSTAYPHGYSRAVNTNLVAILEFRVLEILEDVLPVRAEVTRVLNGAYEEGQEIWVCQHYSEEPVELEIGKTYVTSPIIDYVLGSDGLEAEDAHGIAEYTKFLPMVPYLPLPSAQMGPEGEDLDDPLYDENSRLYEVTGGFYETDIGKRILLLASEASEHMFRAHILATDGLQLLLPFYEKEVYYTEGRAITQEEFDTGARVCLLDSDHAGFNNLKVGDMVDFSFVSAVYGGSLGNMYSDGISTSDPSTLFDAAGELYEPFFEADYEIVGIYTALGASVYDVSNPFSLGYGTVILPSKSIEGSDENNRNGNLILKGHNASFQIPNGTTGAYMKKLAELGLTDYVDITFYDGGYENIKEGLVSIRDMSVVLMLSGAASTVAVLLFFAFLFVGKEKRRTAVERSLGVPKGRCAASLLCGFMLIVVLGTATGVAAGIQSSDFVAAQAETVSAEEGFDTSYSNWVLAQETAAEETPENEAGQAENGNLGISVAVVCGIVLFSLMVSACFAFFNLKKEPMELLSSREN